MPNRIIRDSCKTSQSLAKLSAEAERLFWRLLTVADDFGRFEADPTLLLAKCFPLKIQQYKIRDISKWYAELEACEHVQTYVFNCYHYGFFTGWDKYQHCRAKTSKYPSPTSANICLQMRSETESESETKSETESVIHPLGKTEGAWPAVELLVELYNSRTPQEFPAVNTISPARRKKAKQYLEMFPKIEFWEQVFDNCTSSRFLRGLSNNGAGHENFKADFDWLLSKGKDGTENCVKVSEGKYGD